MKQQIAKLNHLRIAPRKVRLVASSLKGLSVAEAEAQLMTSVKRASTPIRKVLRSAVANAKQNQQISADTLFVKEVRVDQGKTLKRFMPRAMGRATPIHKKSSHITVVLEVREPRPSRFTIMGETKKKKAKEVKAETREKEEKPKTKEKETIKPAAPEQGFGQKVFRRKAV